MKNRRENFLLSGIVLIVFGALFSLGVNIAMGGVVGISGIICFIIGMSIPSQMGMSPEAVADWKPRWKDCRMLAGSCTEWMLQWMSRLNPPSFAGLAVT